MLPRRNKRLCRKLHRKSEHFCQNTKSKQFFFFFSQEFWVLINNQTSVDFTFYSKGLIVCLGAYKGLKIFSVLCLSPLSSIQTTPPWDFMVPDYLQIWRNKPRGPASLQQLQADVTDAVFTFFNSLASSSYRLGMFPFPDFPVVETEI